MRDLDVGGGDRGVHRGLAELALDLALLRLADALLELGAQLVERVVAAGLDGEVVVQLGQPLLLDLLDLDGEGGVLAGEVLGRVVVGERDLDLALVAGGDAVELLLEARDQPARAELDQVAARLAALERLAVDRSGEVDHHEVALPGGALDGLERGERLAQALELRLHLVGVDGRLAAPDLEPLVVAELGRRHHADLDRERERQAALGQVGQVELGVADRGDAGVGHGLLVPARQPAPHRLVHHGLAADLLQHHLGRHLAAAKAGHAHLAAELGRGVLELALERLAGHLDLHAHARVAELGGLRLDGGCHGAAD